MIKKTLTLLVTCCVFAAASAHAGGIEIGDKKDSKLTMGMKAYINLTSTKNETNGAVTAKTTGFAVDRFYLWVNYEMDDIWSAKIVTDVNNEQNTVPALRRKMNVFLKNAYIQGKFNPALIASAGLIGTPWIPYEEKLWGHRYVTNTLVDGQGYDHSADFGLGLKGEVADGLVNYQAAVVNGGGYSNPNKADALDYGLRLTAKPIDGLDISGHYRAGYKGLKTTANPNAAKNTLIQLLASYGIDNARLTAGYISNKAGTTKNKAYDLYGSYEFGNDFAVFARYDNVSTTVAANAVKEKVKRYIIGADYIYNDTLRFSLAYDQAKTTNAGNVANATAKTTKYGLYSQLAF